jgi:Flp pilus assembly protein TadG
MLLRSSRQRRTGVTVIECAVIYPVVFMLLLGLVIGGMGVFRFHEVSALARAGARYASTHGYAYRTDAGQGTGLPGTFTAQDANNWYWYKVDVTQASGTDTSWAGTIYDQAVRSNIFGLNPSKLKFEVAWPPVINQTKPDNWPGSRVTVKVTYEWAPELYFTGPINLSSTSTMPITN